MSESEGPIIGITLSLDHGIRLSRGYEYVYVKRAYAKAIADAGGRPLHISPELDVTSVIAICDGVVISGGDDIPPTFMVNKPCRVYTKSHENAFNGSDNYWTPLPKSARRSLVSAMGCN